MLRINPHSGVNRGIPQKDRVKNGPNRTRAEGKEAFSMDFPLELRAAVERAAEEVGLPRLLDDARTLSRRYRGEERDGSRLLTRESEAAAYAAVRMPATFGAVSAALEYAAERLPAFRPVSLLDVGAGTGAAAWAAEAVFGVESVRCLEREKAMRSWGKRLMAEGPAALRTASFEEYDLAAGPVPGKAELVVASYVLNELPPEGRRAGAERLWAAASGMLLLVEPGTPAGYALLREARDALLSAGARMVAPCPHEGPCPIAGEEWCHFTCRVARSRLHRRLKEGDAPYEDEKFAYLALCRKEILPAGALPEAARVLRHPQVEKGRITLTLCAPDGRKTLTVSKKDAARFRLARKAKCGDPFPL